MFTGIVTEIGKILSSVPSSAGRRLVIASRYPESSIDIGCSICCSGACMTVVEKGENWFAVDVSQESLERTVIGEWVAGTEINLERSLKAADELGGHFVTGHVDGLAEVQAITQIGDNRKITFLVPENLSKFIAEKGSVTLDGVSLTVNNVDSNSFEVNIIPHTLSHTTLGKLEVGNSVNLEIDIIARYTARLLEKNG